MHSLSWAVNMVKTLCWACCSRLKTSGNQEEPFHWLIIIDNINFLSKMKVGHLEKSSSPLKKIKERKKAQNPRGSRIVAVQLCPKALLNRAIYWTKCI